MISRRFLAALAVLCAFIAPANAQKTKAQLATEITTTFPDNTSGSITPLGVRTYETDVINSIMPTAPVVAGNLPCFNGTTGLLQDCGSSPTTVPLTLGTTPINGGTTTRVLFDNAGKLGEYTGTQLTALINPATTLLSGALPAWPNNTTTFFRGDGTYVTLNCAALGGVAASCATDATNATNISTGTLANGRYAAVNLAAGNVNGGVTGAAPIANGGTGQATAAAAISALMPTPTRAGDIAYWNGTNWITIAGNNAGTLTLQENASGVPSWASVAGTGTVTSVVCGTGLSGGTITTSGTCATSLSNVSNVSALVALNNTANFFDGPSIAQGVSGTWRAEGSVTLSDSAGGANFVCKLWDGTTLISSASTQTSGGGTVISLSLSGILASPAANIRISCKDVTSINGSILATANSTGNASTLSAIRIQ